MFKRAKKNKYRAKSPITLKGILAFSIKCLMALTFLSLLSLTAIFTHDFVTQTPSFSIKQIDITGNKHATREEILELAELGTIKNIFALNTGPAEKRIASHPWIKSAVIKRQLPSKLSISLVEHEVLAIVNVGNTAVLINSQGQPFKEYMPDSDDLYKMPIIKGIELTKTNDQYLFSGSLFDSLIQFLKNNKSEDIPENIYEITANEYMGITVLSEDFRKLANDPESDIIPVKLGFADYKAKLERAKGIYDYIGRHFTDRSIHTMDLFDIERAFIRTTLNNTMNE